MITAGVDLWEVAVWEVVVEVSHHAEASHYS
jgi:hypothetical protein